MGFMPLDFGLKNVYKKKTAAKKFVALTRDESFI